MKRRAFLSWVTALVVLLVTASALPAANTAAARIRERLPEIDALKAAGVVGENNVGLVEARTPVSAPQQALIDAENADRLELYKIVARNAGETVEKIGQQRAVRIAELSLPGVWLQNSKGDWYRKQ